MNDLKMQVHIVAKMMGDSVETVLNNYADLNTDNIILEQKQIFIDAESRIISTQNNNN
jgi:hypothetical protein